MDDDMLWWYVGTDPYGDLGYDKEKTREAEEEDNGREPLRRKKE